MFRLSKQCTEAPCRPGDYAAQVASRQSHLILAIASVVQDFSGLMVRVTISQSPQALLQ